MYATCLFCHHRFVTNQVLETFPIGRRLAFDAAKGRLWVVCRRCERWNLTPFEERWETLEACERLFRDARKRVSSDNIGLAKLNEGLELVRIGEPLRPEFAAWRYGDQFGRRRRNAALAGTGVVALAAGIVIGGSWLGAAGGGSWGIYQLLTGAVRRYRRRRVVARVPTEDGARLIVRGAHAERATLRADSYSTVGWRLTLPHTEGTVTLIDHHAAHAAALIMPAVNRAGASRQRVQEAVLAIEEHREPAAFLRHMASLEAAGQRYGAGRRARSAPPAGTIAALSLPTRLAVEMAVNEEHERIALEGELALLELAWKDAEEIAAIADGLTIPSEVDKQLADLKKSVKGET